MMTQLIRQYRRYSALILLTGMLGLLAACSSSSDPAPTPAGPRVVIVDPDDLSSRVNTSQHILVSFDMALDANQDLSLLITLRDPDGNPLATVTDILRPEPNRIDVAHTGLPEGAEVWVELSNRIKGSNGGEMGTPYSWVFWTQSSQPLFLRGLPIDGSTGAPTNTQIFLLFSEQMQLASANSEILVQRVLPDPLSQGPFDLAFTATRGEDDWLILELEAALDPESQTRVTIPASLQTEVGGRTLGVQSFLSFTTATGADTTPPKMTSMWPANGSTISQETAWIRFTFDEPIDPDSFQPSMLGAQFWLLLDHAPAGTQWSENFTVFTIPLPTPLPLGLPIRAMIDEFKDFAGNASTEALDYSIQVTGQADFYPFIDDLRFTFQTKRYWNEGMGQMGPEFRVAYESLRREDPDTWNRVEWDGDFLVDQSWDVLGRSSSLVSLQGFVERDNGTTITTTLSPPVDWLPLPPSAQQWEGTTTASNAGESRTIDYSAELIVQEDRPLFPEDFEGPAKRTTWGKRAEEPQIIWLDCWKWVLSFTMKDGETTVQTGADTLWYAPAVGIVWRRNSEVDELSGYSEWSQSYLNSFHFPGWPDDSPDQ